MVLGSLIVVVTIALLGWRYWSLGQKDAQVAREIDTATREEQRLQEVLKQVAEFENRKNLLEARVALIDELRKGPERAGPHGRSDQQGAARHDVADRDAAERLHPDDSGPLPDADVAVGLHRQPRGVAVFPSSGRNSFETTTDTSDKVPN
jgi:hypothetical protein